MKKNLLFVALVALLITGCASGSLRDGVKPLASNPITAVVAAPILIGYAVADVANVAYYAQASNDGPVVQGVPLDGQVAPHRRRVWQYSMGIPKNVYDSLDDAEYEALIYSLDHPEPK